MSTIDDIEREHRLEHMQGLAEHIDAHAAVLAEIARARRGDRDLDITEDRLDHTEALHETMLAMVTKQLQAHAVTVTGGDAIGERLEERAHAAAKHRTAPVPANIDADVAVEFRSDGQQGEEEGR